MPQSAPIGPENGTLTPRQEAAALALARGCNLREASRESGAGMRTIKGWTASLPPFTRRVVELRGELTAQALGRLVGAMSEASDVLRALLASESEKVRLTAARAVLEIAGKMREAVELEQRLAVLEQQLQGGKR